MYKIRDFIKDLQKRGGYTFSLNEIREKLPAFSDTAIKSALKRLSDANEIVSVLNGFYAIIPISYALRGTVPPELYIDFLMRYLQRPYYVGLLNAASYYGAAHQQPQVFSVITSFPPLRDTFKKGIYITYISKRKNIPQSWLEPIRTESGDIQVSRPELTAADIITFQNKIGGLSRASTILFELAETLDFKLLDEQFFSFVPVATIQRLGYLCENILEQSKKAEDLYIKAQEYGCGFQKVPLKSGKDSDKSIIDKRWKIILNEQVEIDDL